MIGVLSGSRLRGVGCMNTLITHLQLGLSVTNPLKQFQNPLAIGKYES